MNNMLNLYHFWRAIMLKNVNRYTRAGRFGKQITCPKCNHTETVYHFAWSACGCLGCKDYINKEDFLVEV